MTEHEFEQLAEKIAAKLAIKLSSKNPGFMRQDMCLERSGAIKTRINWLYALVGGTFLAVLGVLGKMFSMGKG